MERVRRLTHDSIARKIAATVVSVSLLGGCASKVESGSQQACQPKIEVGTLLTHSNIQSKPGKSISHDDSSILNLSPIPPNKNYFSKAFDVAERDNKLNKSHVPDDSFLPMKRANVKIVVDTPSDIDRFCNGVHIGKGKIATVEHCVEDYAPQELKITVFDSNNQEHQGISVSHYPGLDGAIIHTQDDVYPGSSKVGKLQDLPPNNYVATYASGQEEPAYYESLYFGGFKNDSIPGCDGTNDKYNFIMLAGENKGKHGHNGSGIYNPKNGELIGFFISIIRTPTHPFQVLEGIRAEVIGELNKPR